jgi:hypothetical protein
MRSFVFAALFASIGAAAGMVATLSHDARAAGSGPDTGPRIIPYDGYLELDAVPYNGTLPVEFELSNGSNVWTQRFDALPIHGGRFSANLGSGGATLPQWIFASPTVSVAITVDGVRLANSQRIVPAPYAYWSAEGADFPVSGDLSVSRDTFVGRNLNVGGTLGVSGSTSTGALTATGGVSAIGNVSATGNVAATGNVSASGNVVSTGDVTAGDQVLAASVELRGGVGGAPNPYIDFSNTSGVDFNSRLMLQDFFSFKILSVDGAILNPNAGILVGSSTSQFLGPVTFSSDVSGTGRVCLVHDVCRDTANFSCGGTGTCGPNEFVVGSTDGTSCSVSNRLRCCTVRLGACP